MIPTKAGRYELIREIGRGAMGVVFQAFDPVLGRTVAVKTMRLTELGTGLARPELLARFQSEARAAGKLVHPNIVTIYDAGEDEGQYFITMEFVEGRCLQNLLDQRQVFPLSRILSIMQQGCSALDFAHQRGVVHRDIKPANLLLTSDGALKVTDFGTAKILSLNTTTTGTIVGTPSYMSPEQVKGKPVDGRSDIFSLGVILYELVTGEKPFPGESLTTVIYKIVNEEPVSPRKLDASVHPGLCEVILKALAKDPDARHATCREFFHALENYRTLGQSNLMPPPVSAAPASAARVPAAPAPPARAPVQQPASIPASAPEPAARRTVSRKRGSRTAVLAVSAVCLAALGFIIFQGRLGALLSSARRAATSPASAPVAPPPAPVEKPAVPEPAKSKPTTETPAPAAVAKSPASESSPRKATNAPAEIQLSTDVPGARAVLRGPDDRPSGECTTPCRFEHLDAGRYQLEVSKSGYRIERRIVNLNPGESSALHVPMQAAQGVLQVNSRPEGAEIFVNGARMGQTPATLTLPAGSYKIRLQRPGAEPYETSVQLDESDFKTLNVSGLTDRPAVAQRTGWLDVKSAPRGADILVDGKSTGQKTPARIELPEGQHTLTLYVKGYARSTQAITITANQTLPVNQALARQ